MDEKPAKKLSNRRSEERRSDGESSSSSSEGRASRKRKANPVTTNSKRQRVSEMAELCGCDTVGVITQSQRKMTDDGEGPSQQETKAQKLDPLRPEESTTSSPDNETSTEPFEGCSAFAGDVNQTQLKRKADAETERPSKRIRKSLNLQEKVAAEVQRETSTDPLEGGSALIGGVTRTPVKRKADPETEQPSKRIRKSLNLQEKVAAEVQRETSTDPLEGGSALIGDVTRTQTQTERPNKRIRKSLNLREKIAAEVQRAQFEVKYRQEEQLGEGGCGCVFAGYRIADELPVAIKHIPENKVFCKQPGQNGKRLSTEVAVMQKLSDGTEGSVGTSVSVSLLDWYDLGSELVLVLERPEPCEDLYTYILTNGPLPEEEAKVILTQLLHGLTELHSNRIFHRDIKTENILIETGSDVPRVRLIDFGLSCFFKTRSIYRVFYGTPHHVPPEFYARHSYRPGPTTVWQLGVVLYEMLHCIYFRTISFLREQQIFNNELSENCRDFLRMCLNKVPGERPSLEELHLHPWLRGADVNTPSPDSRL